MKLNQLAGFAVAVLIAILFSTLVLRQSGLDTEIATLHAELKVVQASKSPPPVFTQSPGETYPTTDTPHIGKPEPISNDERLATALDRVSELERVVNAQADILDGYIAEKNRIEEARRKASMRSWGPEQASGAPDTQTAGDQRTAWAAATADGGVEWLEAEFEHTTDLAKIIVRQTNNPGGITKVVAIADNGTEIPIWAGTDPSTGQSIADTPFPVPTSIQAKRVKIYIDTAKKPGWEEVDALQIIGRDGDSQWAKSVKASSTYASGKSGSILSLDLAEPLIEAESTLRMLSR